MDTAFNTLDLCALELSCFLEESGELAVPVAADRPYFFWDNYKQEGRGDLSHKHAAVLAGLGSLGKNSLLLTPNHGNRINLVSVVTTKRLEGDPLIDHNLCLENCSLCIDSCPGKAIGSNGEINQKNCRKYHSIKSLRGFSLFACWECRRVCPVNGVV